MVVARTGPGVCLDLPELLTPFWLYRITDVPMSHEHVKGAGKKSGP